MRTWNDYKEHVKTVDPEIAKDIKKTEGIVAIVTAMVDQRTVLGLSQRDLAGCVVYHNLRLQGLDHVRQLRISERY